MGRREGEREGGRVDYAGDQQLNGEGGKIGQASNGGANTQRGSAWLERSSNWVGAGSEGSWGAVFAENGVYNGV